MNNGVRKVVAIVLLGGLVTVIVLGLIWLKANFSSRLSPQQAIPADFVFCIEGADYQRLVSALQNQSNIWKEFQEYDFVSELNSQISKIDSLAREFSDLNRLFEGDILLSVHPVESSFSSLIALSSPEDKATDQVLKLISSETIIEKEKFESATIYRLDPGKNFPFSFSFSETRGVVLFSRSPELLKKAVLQLQEEESAFEAREYQRLKATAGADVEAHIYVNFQRLEDFAGTLIRKEELPGLSAFGETAALDVDVKPNHLVLNGFSSMSDTVFQLFSALGGQQPVEQKLFGIVPSTAVFFKWIGLSDPSVFSKRLEALYPNEGDQPRDFRQGFYSMLNGQVAEVHLRESNGKNNTMMVISVKSGGIAEDFLKENLVLKSGLTELTSEKIPAGNNREVNAHKIAVKGMVELLFGSFFRGTEPEWFCFLDNYLVLGSSPRELQHFLYQNSLGKTLENDMYFQSLKENFSSRSNYFIYTDPSRSYIEILESLQPEARKIMAEQPGVWQKLNVAGFQGTVAGDLNYFRLFVHYTGQVREFVNTVWERKMEGQLAIKPAIVQNHESGEKEILIQDEHHSLYLIGNRGELIWKQNTDARILSEIFQIDYYRNGKLQYLFNTESKIYLLDRNGNNVGSFPVALREKASAGLALLDYDNNKDYRIPVPTVEKGILMYDRNGKTVPGWNFGKTDHLVSFPLEHYRVGDKDFIVARDAFRLYMLDRRGRIRLRHQQQIDFSENNPIYYIPRTGSKSSRLLASDREGSLYAFYFDGKVEKLMDQKIGEGHYFLPSDLNGDGRYEYVFTDSSHLKVMSSENRLVFEKEYPDTISLRPFIYTFSSSDKKIGLSLPGMGRIYLVNNDGSLYKGFPLKGSSYFSIASFPGLKDRFNLIVGHKDNFLYNYSVK